MGQCCGRVLSRSRWGRRQHFRHKAFEFAPKRSWKYKDANLLGGSGSEEEGEDLELSTVINTNASTERESQEDSEEEVSTGEIRRSGLLAFDEDSDNEDEVEVKATPLSPTQYEAVQTRDRTASNSSQQIGRFEVMVIEEEQAASASTGSQETSNLIHLAHSNPPLQATA